jgi:hypothetical protein
VKGAAAGSVRKRSRAFHFLPFGIATVDPVRIKLYPNCLRVEVVEIYGNLKNVILTTSFNLHFAEV